ncbi:major facilitator superfamily domain-containing protein [Aspergillus pseudoustus]|uniref:Major facilitator superfamily domain-containing protein n=1 Tax=Aspergillus pseudoustus TaxID=1810923 RepID=A0ABR4IE77_9EURO
MTERLTGGLRSTASTHTDVERESADQMPTTDPEKPKDPNIVDFEGPDDPANPLNWSPRKKFINIAIISLMTLLSPTTSTISSPITPTIMSHFGSTNSTLGAFVTTVFLLGYTFGPCALAPLSELYGRAPLYKVCIVLFLIFNVACAVAPSMDSLIAFRFLAGIMGSCPVTLGPGSVSDMVSADKRAGAMSAYVIGIILGPSVGPIAAGYLAPAAGWRWVFWLVVIAIGVVAVPVMFLAESYPYVILQRKTERLRKNTGNEKLKSALDTGTTPRELFAFSIWRPLKMLLSPIIFLLSLYCALVYSYLYLCFTTFPVLLSEEYGFGSGPSGLATLGLGVGSVLGLFVCGASDKISKYLAEKHGGETKPEYRLPILIVGAFLTPIGLFWYGWTAYYRTHWILPILGTGFIGAGMVIAFMATTMYLVDAFTLYSASATAANTILRCLFAALLPLAGPAMFAKLDYGWGNSLLGFLAVAFIPVPFVFYRYGERIRESSVFKIEF